MEPSESPAGGRVTLRLSSSTKDRVEYAAEIATARGGWAAHATISVPDGAVALSGGSDGAPPWLLALARATLRVAWRASRAGAPWPRRINRWRPSPDTDGEG